jgi:hypothetical protein
VAGLGLLINTPLLLVTAGIFSYAAYATSSAGKAVFGPAMYKPGIYFRVFRITAPSGPYQLVIANGNPATGQDRANSAVIKLNGSARIEPCAPR